MRNVEMMAYEELTTEEREMLDKKHKKAVIMSYVEFGVRATLELSIIVLLSIYTPLPWFAALPLVVIFGHAFWLVSKI